MTSDKIKCPCCGQIASASGVRVSLEWNALYFREVEVGLTPQEAELAFILARRMPETVNYDTIIRQLWGDREIDFAMSRVKSVIHHLRCKLLRAGLGVANYKERGYGFVVLPRLVRTERFSTVTGAEHATP